MPQRVDQLIERVRTVPATRAGDQRLVAMLRQGARHFSGLSSGDADRVRGHVLASFEHRRLSASAIHAAKEELRTSLSPIVIAGAARAIGRLVGVDPECRALLITASRRLEVRDEVVRFDAPDSATARTARDEIAFILAHRQEAPAHCCGATVTASPRCEAPQPISLCSKVLSRAVVEDQSEARTPLLDLLRDRASLVAFFYTRCMNPEKCSLTISRLAELTHRASAHPSASALSFLAISYDPDFDAPSRLHAFGRDRGFPFSGNAKLLRCIAGWSGTRRMFGLEVGYGEATVNAHARELFLVSGQLEAVGIDCEQLSEPARLLERLCAA